MFPDVRMQRIFFKYLFPDTRHEEEERVKETWIARAHLRGHAVEIV